MHDFHLADQIFKIIIDFAKQKNLKKVTKAEIDLGSIVEHGEEVLPENLKFNIKMLAEGTVAADLDVNIERIKSDSWILKSIDGE